LSRKWKITSFQLYIRAALLEQGELRLGGHDTPLWNYIKGRKPYFFFLPLSGACVSADPATLLAALVDFGLFSTLEAALATFADVFSFLAMFASFR
tara:strand:+ start:2783 stop:3070 length:288 start_codon:yes stop_codon:yes gene_type:complete